MLFLCCIVFDMIKQYDTGPDGEGSRCNTGLYMHDLHFGGSDYSQPRMSSVVFGDTMVHNID